MSKKEYFRKFMEQIEVLLSVTTVLQIHKKRQAMVSCNILR